MIIRLLTMKDTKSTNEKRGVFFSTFVLSMLFVVNLFLLTLSSLSADEVSARKTFVLVVGIDHYPLPYGKLNYAAEDAEKIANVMREQGIADYKKEKDEWVYANKTEVILLSDKNGNSQLFPTKANILRELESILKNAKEDDFVMIYFSGHGTGESLVTVMQDGKVETIEVKEILSKLDTKTKEYMLLLDACRNTTNPVAPFSTTIEPGDGGFKSIFYATSKDNVSQESNKLGQGVYSYYLLEGLKGKADTDGDLIVSSDEIRNYVSEKVIAFTDNTQKPQLHQISSASKFLTRVTKPGPWQYIWKSAILPGAGQWEKGHKSNSIFYFSIALLGGFNLYSNNLTYEREEKEYFARQSLFLISSPMVLDSTDLILFQAMQSVRKDLITDSRSIETGVDFFILFYLWNLWDAGFTKNEWIDLNKPRTKLDSGYYNGGVGQQEQRFRLTVEWNF